MTDAKERPIVCPFCPICCDDVVLERTGSVLTDCQIARDEFANALEMPRARVGTEHVALDDAVIAARELLMHRMAISVLTVGTDLETSRRLSQLMQVGRAQIFIEETSTQAALRSSISRDGVVAATLGDIRKHADLIFSIGGIERDSPRFWNQLDSDAQRICEPNISSNTLAPMIAAFRTDDDRAERYDHRFVDQAIDSNYIAIVVASDAFADFDATSAAQLLIQLVWELNQTARCVLLTLDSAATLRSVVRWQSNSNTTEAFELGGSADIRIGTPGNTGANSASIQLGGRDLSSDTTKIYVPTSTAGVTKRGIVTRGDGTVTMPLQKISETTLPSSAELIESWLIEPSDNNCG